MRQPNIREKIIPVYFTNDGERHASREEAEAHHKRIAHSLAADRKRLKIAVEKQKELKKEVASVVDGSHPFFLKMRECPGYRKNLLKNRQAHVKKQSRDILWLTILIAEKQEKLREPDKKRGLDRLPMFAKVRV